MGIQIVYFCIVQGNIKASVLDFGIYYKPINDTTFELSVFWPSDSEIWINELRFYDYI